VRRDLAIDLTEFGTGDSKSFNLRKKGRFYFVKIER